MLDVQGEEGDPQPVLGLSALADERQFTETGGVKAREQRIVDGREGPERGALWVA